MVRANFFDINRKAVLAMRMVGRGLKGLNIVTCILDMPKPMTRHTYECHQKALCMAAAKVGKKSMETAAATVLAKRSDELCPDEIAVSTDGTRMRRGHSSLYGIRTVISYDTKRILDTCALSKKCKQCSAWKRRYQDGAIPEEEYGDWLATHADSCDINTSVSAPAMETEAAVKLWNRSVESHGLKCTMYIGDGDSNGFNAVVKAKPYDDTDIVKEECIGHIQKRLGKGLRELKKKLGSELLSDGEPLCGKGRLTDKYMDRLENYYGIAIRSNVGRVENMYRATWPSLCHRSSTDDNPRHQFCPTGKESWCKWQQQAAGKPGVIVEHKDGLPNAVPNAIKPLYVRLTERPLLERCVRGATQNVNEWYNGMLWRLCPKETFCGVETLQTAVHLATAIFNHGCETLVGVFSMPCNAHTHSSQLQA